LQKRHLIWLSVILLLFALFSSLNSIGLRAEESRRAVTGMEIYQSGNVIVPQIHGCPYYNKPPLFSILVAASYAITGSFEEWAVRLPSLFAFLLTGLLSFWVARKFTNSETAFLAAMAYLTSADLLFYACVNTGEIDLFFTLVAFAQIISIFLFYYEKKYIAMFVTSYFLAALGVLTKGMPSIAIQVITVSAYLFYQKDWKVYFSRKHFLGILVFIAITGCYFYLYSKQNNVIGFIENLYKESSKRTISEAPALTSLTSIFTFPLQLFEILLPWSFFVIYIFRKDVRKTVVSNPYLLFSVIYVLGNIIIYWLAPEFKNRYAYIFLPSLAFILVYFYTTFKDTDSKKTQIAGLLGLIILGLAPLCILTTPYFDIVKNHVKNAQVLSFIFSAIYALIFILYYSKKTLRVYIFLIALLIGRIGFNIFLLPFFRLDCEANEYKQHADKMIAIANNETIYYTGDSLKISPDISLFALKIARTTIYTPPQLPYQIPYYLGRSTNKILEYTTKTEKGKLYLVHMRDLKDFHINILYSFQDKWGNDKRMILYRKK